MGGVDLSDALITYYTALHKTKKWYRTFFYHFLDIAIVNAFILFNKTHPEQAMRQRDFRDRLIEELADHGSPSTSTSRPAPHAAESASHMPFYFTEGMDVPQGQAATAGRRQCALCHKKTPVGCSTCGNVPLCFLSSRNCFRQYHSEEEQ